jgi:hypothetical protein
MYVMARAIKWPLEAHSKKGRAEYFYDNGQQGTKLALLSYKKKPAQKIEAASISKVLQNLNKITNITHSLQRQFHGLPEIVFCKVQNIRTFMSS